MIGTLVSNKNVEDPDVIGASPVDAAPTTTSFSTEHLASMDWAKATTWQDEKYLSFGFGAAYITYLTAYFTHNSIIDNL